MSATDIEREGRLSDMETQRAEIRELRAEIERLRAAIREAQIALYGAATHDGDPAWDAALKIDAVLLPTPERKTG